jgi:hypothetical protein
MFAFKQEHDNERKVVAMFAEKEKRERAKTTEPDK